MSNKATVVVILVALVASLAIMGSMFKSMEPEQKDVLELSGNVMTLEEGQTHMMTFCTLAYPLKYSDVKWSVDDEAILTVEDGLVMGVISGSTAKVTATVTYGGKNYSDSCRISVVEPGTLVNTLRMYDAYSEKSDYMVLTGDGFEKGLLSATFNSDNEIVIALAGYDKDWFDLSLHARNNFIGSANRDWDRITMTVSNDGTPITTQTFTNLHNGTHDDGNYTALMTFGDWEYGEYDVVFTLSLNNPMMCPTQTVSAHFEIVEGNGERDTNSQFVRAYAWKCDADEDGTLDNDEVFSFTQAYDYEDYWNTYYPNSKTIFTYHGNMHNARYNGYCVSLCNTEGTIKDLYQSLEDLYTSNGNDLADSQRFAQFLLTFVQINYLYEYDSVQYGKGSSNGVDFWAYSDETVFSGVGDCEDTSIVAASLFKVAGYDAGLILLDDHMMASVSLDSYDDHGLRGVDANFLNDGDIFYMCETTVDSPVIHRVPSLQGEVYYYEVVYPGKSLGAYAYYIVGMVSSGYSGEMYEFFRL